MEQQGSRREGIPGAGEGIPGDRNRIPGDREGIPGAGEGIPGVRDEISGPGDEISGPGDGIPGPGDEISGVGDGIPGPGDGIPGAGDEISGVGDGIPGVGDEISGDRDGIPSVRDGIPGVGDGIPGVGDGIPGVRDGIPGPGDGIPSVGDEISGAGDEISGVGDGIPGAGEGIPGVGNEIPGPGDGIPGVEDGIPGAGDEISGVGDGIPGVGDEISGDRDGIPGVGDGIPGDRDGIPGVGDGIPGVGDGIPGDRDGIPGVGDGIPGVGDEISGDRDGIPGVGDGIPGDRDGIPGVGDGIPGVRDGIPSVRDGVSGDGGGIPGVGDGIPGVEDEIPRVDREIPAPTGEGAERGSGHGKGVSGPERAPEGSPEEPRVEQPLQERGSSLSAPQTIPGTAAEPPRAQPPGREEDFYCVKWISWKGERTPVVTQSENGPCPLLAIINILLLQWKVKLPPQKEVITAEELMAHLGNCILATQPRDTSEALQLNFQQNINDTMTVLPKLSTGLDVNVRFTGVSDFEYTPECIVFDLLNIPLYHGWLVDPQSPEQVQAVGKLSYNQLVEKIITCKQASDSSLVSEGLVAEQFLESTASQLTFHGLCELTARAREGKLGVFFRNNHFSTMIKHKGHLYLLVTDQGFLQEEGVVWESLHSVDGDSCFCDTEFHLSHATGKEGATAAAPPEHRLQQSQVEQDYMVALSLQQGQLSPSLLSDLELARQLQQEEYQQHHPHPFPQLGPSQPLPPPQAGGRAAGERRQRQRPDLDCTLL